MSDYEIQTYILHLQLGFYLAAIKPLSPLPSQNAHSLIKHLFNTQRHTRKGQHYLFVTPFTLALLVTVIDGYELMAYFYCHIISIYYVMSICSMNYCQESSDRRSIRE